jgi:hypothetical protein
MHFSKSGIRTEDSFIDMVNPRPGESAELAPVHYAIGNAAPRGHSSRGRSRSALPVVDFSAADHARGPSAGS